MQLASTINPRADDAILDMVFVPSTHGGHSRGSGLMRSKLWGVLLLLLLLLCIHIYSAKTTLKRVYVLYIKSNDES